MYKRIKIVFLLLVLFQGLHSIEEYFGRLWVVLAPAKVISESVSSNPGTGFIIVNVSLFIFGILCWWIATRKKQISYQGLIWLWVIIEILNVIGHPILALRQHGYFPGVYTAPALLILALYLVKLLLEPGKGFSRNIIH